MATTYHVPDIRNVALAGHGASGKTSLADALLFAAGITTRRGSPDDGTSTSDFDDEEKKRHYTIDCHLLHLAWHGKQVHLIDSPGYPDFIGNALSALAAVENVVIAVSAPHGPEVNTRRMFQEATRLGLGRIIALTKMDADNVDYRRDLDVIRDTFGPQCVPFNVPIGQGPSFSGVVDVLDEPPASGPEGDLPLPIDEAHRMLLDQIVELDEELMARYLEGETIPLEQLRPAVHNAIAAGQLVPIIAVSVKKDIGVKDLLDLLADCGLNPSDIRRVATDAEGADEHPVDPLEDGEVVAQVFKTTNDLFMGKLSYLRIHSGRIVKDSTLVNVRTGKTSKLGHLYVLQGKAHEEVQEAIAGDIIAVAKFDDLHVSDTVTVAGAGTSGANGHATVLKPISFPTPMVPRAVQPKTREDEPKVSASLAKIADEDPTLTIRRDAQTHELVITGMSDLHLDVVQARLKGRYKLDINTHVPHVPYLETIGGSAEAKHRHKKQTGGRGQFADVQIRIRPLERGAGFKFVDAIKGGVIPANFIPAVEKGIREQLELGVISGNKVVDVEVELFFGGYHDVDSSEQAFKTAARNAFRKGFVEAKPLMLEPIVEAEIIVPADKAGAITGELSTRRGHVSGMDALAGGQQVIRATVPLAEILSYASTLKSMTGGQGSFSMELAGYDMVPANIQKQLMDKYAKSRAGIEED